MPTGNTLPDPQTAYSNIFGGIYQQVFFHKMASHGYAPRTTAQAQHMLDVAAKLRTVDNSPAKAAADENDPFAIASRNLDVALGRAGLDGPIKAAEAQEAQLSIHKAAAQLAQDPTFYNSILSLKAAEAEQFMAQTGQN
jgi:hypothetical protein